MISRNRFLSLAVAVFGFAATQRSAQTPPIARAEQRFLELERTLLERPDLRPVLEDSRAMFARIVRNLPRAAKSWQLEPSLARELSDTELFDFVTARANSLLVCGLDVMTQKPLEFVDQQTIATLDVRRAYWPAATEGPLRLTPDCATLVNPKGQPIRLRTRSELAMFSKLYSQFKTAAVTELLKERQVGRGPQFAENLSYLRREAGPPELRPDVAAAASLAPPATLSGGQVLTLFAFATVDDGPPRIVFVVPLTW
jgi:hypothetical protein